ncbi:MAG: AsmA-like C-terminal region-containing protein, partial [Cyclobacteriaceae bacterium]
EQLKYKKFIERVKTSGELALNAIYLEFSDLTPGLRNLNGGLRFSNNDLALSDVSGKFGRSDFLLNGYFKNVIAYLLFEDEPVGIEARLKSNFIDLDELLSLQDGGNSENYSFRISNRLRVMFDCEIDRLQFRRFHPTGIHGDLKIKNQVAFTDRLSFNNMGGKIQLAGMADASRNQYLRISTNFKLDHIAVDSIFYVFENFDQDFLEDRHLKGFIDASVDAEMMLNDELHLYPETLRSHINASIKGGELNDFEPLQKLAPYLDETGLRHLRFSELANDIIIRDRTIYLPRMEVGSNVTDIVISGTHTFDQKIDYSIQAPLQSKEKYDTDEAFGAIRDDGQGRAMLFLKIVGTTSEYYVSYDKENVKKKIASDIKKEAEELKTIFRNKGKEEETVELTEDDYFDWEDDKKDKKKKNDN